MTKVEGSNVVRACLGAMAGEGRSGGWARALYSGVMSSITPLLYLNLQCRRWQGGQSYGRWRECMGYASRERPPGLLIWFHAVSVGMCSNIFSLPLPHSLSVGVDCTGLLGTQSRCDVVKLNHCILIALQHRQPLTLNPAL